MNFSVAVAIYLLGGITFIPLLLSLLLLHAYLAFPVKEPTQDTGTGNDDASIPSPKPATAFPGLEGLPDELKVRPIVPDAAAGYFAVCREFVPGGTNGKPPDRSTQPATSIAPESPSVYQSMYRSVFDRNKTSTSTLEGSKLKNKKSRNVFYIVLRLGHLMMYDDADQLEVRHVLSLAHYEIDIYAGGDDVPEGELWIKRNCLRLSQTSQVQASAMDSQPYYLFSENSSEKEDFYHAMLRSQESGPCRTRPEPLGFDSADAVKLVQQLHASEETLHTRWINALIGRLFLALYKTSHVEKMIWTKITKKISRVPKPAFISNVHVRKIDMGHLPPFITNPKLRELTIEGDMVVEADISYKGNFRLEVSAIARIELGTRFKPREVTLVLASILKKLDGHVLLRIKPPPSNRIWVSFETVPKMELSLEPIVSTRQITYGVILRAIENRIREVVSETLVFPNWDDIPFSDSQLLQFRGGIWANTEQLGESQLPLEDQTSPNTANGRTDLEDGASNVPTSQFVQKDEIQSSTTPLDIVSSLDQNLGPWTATESQPPTKPKAMRSGSFSSVASPLVDLNAANASVTATDVAGFDEVVPTSIGTLSRRRPKTSQISSISSPDQHKDAEMESSIRSMSHKHHSVISEDPDSQSNQGHVSPQNISESVDKRQIFSQSLNSAMAAGKKWFVARQTSDASANLATTLGTAEDPLRHDYSQDTSLSKSYDEREIDSTFPPMGRGQPLPPPGVPLPSPKADKRWAIPATSTFANLTKRKPVSLKMPTSFQDSDSLHDYYEPSSHLNNASSASRGAETVSHPGAINTTKGSRRKLSLVQSGGFSGPTTRRSRLSNPETHVQEMFVVEAPVTSPIDIEQDHGQRRGQSASDLQTNSDSPPL
ncbi:hypothetical protein P154DRAFT_491587 [Amniculicola lignicola CBS 123094]|uniref:SMP-LTD domain-containing protein n=1 Tax=Amniculicola lignicola CBS 123094 TaxID=1392246 RepID=A0A6A5WIF0_9PLEO|nr:hypothetical protein P154DRAFT_491587 [Amniculicola lignicola CBS 123094]